MAESMVERVDLGPAAGPQCEAETCCPPKAAVEVKCRCPYCGDSMVRE